MTNGLIGRLTRVGFSSGHRGASGPPSVESCIANVAAVKTPCGYQPDAPCSMESHVVVVGTIAGGVRSRIRPLIVEKKRTPVTPS